MSTSHLSPLVQQALQASASGDTTAALRLFESAILQTPQDAVAHFLMAAELAQTGQLETAEAAFARAVLLAPTFEVARFQLGLLQFTSGRPAIAMLSWTPLLALPQSSPFHQFVSGFAALAAEQFDDAAQLLRRGIELNVENLPLNADIQKVLARIHARTGIPSAPSDATGEPSPTHHVLLSNYHHDGSIH